MTEAFVGCIAWGCGVAWIINAAGYFAQEILSFLRSL